MIPATAIAVGDYERKEWTRLARDAYSKGRNSYGHRFSVAATRKELPPAQFEELMAIYRKWLNWGWRELPEHVSNPRRRRRPTHTAVFDRCVKEVGASARNPYAVCQAELGSRALISSRRNPRRGAPRAAYYTITAYKRRRGVGERVIRELYFTGDRFSRSSSGVVKFPTRELAAKFARYLVRSFGRPLKGWRLRVS